MQDIEPFYNWRHLYAAEEDPLSPFFRRIYSEFEFSLTVYNYYIHPQWDEFGSKTLYMKILFTEYEQGYTIMMNYIKRGLQNISLSPRMYLIFTAAMTTIMKNGGNNWRMREAG